MKRHRRRRKTTKKHKRSSGQAHAEQAKAILEHSLGVLFEIPPEEEVEELDRQAHMTKTYLDSIVWGWWNGYETFYKLQSEAGLSLSEAYQILGGHWGAFKLDSLTVGKGIHDAAWLSYAIGEIADNFYGGEVLIRYNQQSGWCVAFNEAGFEDAKSFQLLRDALEEIFLLHADDWKRIPDKI